jgi:lincosamide nucleotidyltransferase A/C/D/E
MMTADDVLEVIDALEGAGVSVWIDGGWGIDALVGEQTRPHDDLDVVIRIEDAVAARSAA